MKNSYQIIGRAVELYDERENLAYFYGAKGQYLTEELMDTLISFYPEHFGKYTAEELVEIKNFSRGKRGFDCSGFVSECVGQTNYSLGFYANGVNKTSPKLGTSGNMLVTTFNNTGRHIGIDIGHGRFLHMGTEGKSVEMGYIKDYPWECSAQFAGVSYTFAVN